MKVDWSLWRSWCTHVFTDGSFWKLPPGTPSGADFLGVAFGVPVYRWQPVVPYEIMVGAARRVAATLTVLKPLHAAALREVETIPDGTSLDRFPAQTVAELRVLGWIQPVAPGSDRYMLTDLGAEVLEGRPRDHDPHVAAQVRETPR